METTNNKLETVNNQSRWNTLLGIIFGYVFFVVLLMGMVFYLVVQYSNDSFQPFTLATAVALIGGVTLSTAFSAKCPDNIRPRLRKVGALCLVATVSFIVFGFFQPIDKAGIHALDGVLKWVIPIFFYMGAISFIIAILMTLLVIPKIFFIKDN